MDTQNHRSIRPLNPRPNTTSKAGTTLIMISPCEMYIRPPKIKFNRSLLHSQGSPSPTGRNVLNFARKNAVFSKTWYWAKGPKYSACLPRQRGSSEISYSGLKMTKTTDFRRLPINLRYKNPRIQRISCNPNANLESRKMWQDTQTSAESTIFPAALFTIKRLGKDQVQRPCTKQNWTSVNNKWNSVEGIISALRKRARIPGRKLTLEDKRSLATPEKREEKDELFPEVPPSNTKGESKKIVVNMNFGTKSIDIDDEPVYIVRRLN